MVIVDTNVHFPDYIKSLSKHARKDYAYTTKHNRGLVYEAVPFVRDEVEAFMGLWSRQLIRGQCREWAFPIGHVEGLDRDGKLRVFGVRDGDRRVGLHFIQARDGFWECHPPMYDKEYGSRRYLAKFMWFNLIDYGSRHQLGLLDLGGGVDNWHEMIKRKDDFPNPRYKWIYVPQDIQEHPEKYPNYIIEDYYGDKRIRTI
jgi:hypothetical protein